MLDGDHDFYLNTALDMYEKSLISSMGSVKTFWSPFNVKNSDETSSEDSSEATHDKFAWTWTCDPCCLFLETYFSWNQHFCDNHINKLNELVFSCDTCQKRFLDLGMLQHHHQEEHSQVYIHCTNCGADFQFFQSVSKHKC